MKYVFSVNDMSCGHCKAHIEEALEKSGSVSSFDVDLGLKKVEVDTVLSATEVVTIIQEAGYTAELRA